jgi:outer membrane murein-binding lipoprotein Lpp
MSFGTVPPPQVPPAQEPASQVPQSYGQPYTPQPQYGQPGYPSYSGTPEKKSSGNTGLVITLVVLAVAAIGGWVLYFIKNNALNLANADISQKTTEISNLNSSLDTANGEIDTLSSQLAAAKSDANRYSAQVTQMTSLYKCPGISLSSFSFGNKSNDSVLSSLERYVSSNYGTVVDSTWTFLTPLTEPEFTSIHLIATSDDQIYSFVVYFADDSKTGKNRIYFVNDECYIE